MALKGKTINIIIPKTISSFFFKVCQTKRVNLKKTQKALVTEVHRTVEQNRISVN